jgi:hypothetical protein
MKTSSPFARAYRQLGYLAIAHSVVLLGIAVFFLTVRKHGRSRLLVSSALVGLVALWFLWPIVLALHPGRSALRLTVFVSIAAVLLLPSLRFFGMTAPWVLGFPDGVTLNPISSWQYFSAYRAGRFQAQKDLAAGILAIEEFGFGAGTATEILRERYHIEVRVVAGCVVDEKILGHAAGYNKVSQAEIDRRFGLKRLAEAQEEGAKLTTEEIARKRQFTEDLAKRLSSLPPDAKIMTESIWLYVDQQPLVNDPVPEAELALLVHAVEKYLVEHVPKDAPSFKLYVSVQATPTSDPKFGISSWWNTPPKSVWENIHNNQQTIVAPGWNKGSLTGGLYLVVR